MPASVGEWLAARRLKDRMGSAVKCIAQCRDGKGVYSCVGCEGSKRCEYHQRYNNAYNEYIERFSKP